MTGAEHVAQVENRLRASDYHWQESQDEIGALGALREAAVAQVHATLALASAQEATAEATRGVQLALEETVAGR